MDTFLAIASRREVRDYEPRALPPEVEERILDAGRLAGSSKNRQPWRFDIVPGEHLIVARSEQAMAEAIAHLMRDPVRWKILSQNGRALVRARYVAETAFRALDEALAQSPARS